MRRSKKTSLWLTIPLVLVATGSLAESHRLQPDFTFRRIKPPDRTHKGPRITVQIEEAAPRASEPEAAVDAPTQPQPFRWFWDAVPDKRDADAAQRVRRALDILEAKGSQVRAPRLATLKQITDQYGSQLLAESIGTKVSPALALAVIAVESGGNPTAQSSAGAQGLMQLIPATAERFGVSNPNDPAQNIKGGVAYLDWLLTHFDGDVVLALAGYNAGEGAVRDHKGVPPYAETRGYVPKVLAAWRVARGLCITPPELTSDGCVFVR